MATIQHTLKPNIQEVWRNRRSRNNI